LSAVRLFSRTPSIDAESAADLLAKRTVVVVDVRQPAEWKGGHIRGAVQIPLTQLSSRVHELPRDKTIVTVCRSGHRSALAARTLTRRGHDVLNLRGGMIAWIKAGLPLSPSTMTRRHR
jgi:rhodanese-related sulfurtransferase